MSFHICTRHLICAHVMYQVIDQLTNTAQLTTHKHSKHLQTCLHRGATMEDDGWCIETWAYMRTLCVVNCCNTLQHIATHCNSTLCVMNCSPRLYMYILWQWRMMYWDLGTHNILFTVTVYYAVSRTPRPTMYRYILSEQAITHKYFLLRHVFWLVHFECIFKWNRLTHSVYLPEELTVNYVTPK